MHPLRAMPKRRRNATGKGMNGGNANTLPTSYHISLDILKLDCSRDSCAESRHWKMDNGGNAGRAAVRDRI